METNKSSRKLLGWQALGKKKDYPPPDKVKLFMIIAKMLRTPKN